MQAGESFEIANSELAKITAKAATFVFEAKGLEVHAVSSGIEVPVAIGIIGELLREYAKNVMAGSAPATLPAAEVHKPEITKRPVTVPMFAAKHVKWINAEGQIQICRRYDDCELPEATAARALKSKACWSITDPRRRELKGSWDAHPSAAQCTDLDAVDESAAVNTASSEPVQLFQRVDRGAPVTGTARVAGASS
jgi:hypothetical protein